MRRQFPRDSGAVELGPPRQHRAAGDADPELIDGDRTWSIAQLRQERLQLLPRRSGAVDIERNKRFVGPFCLGTCKRTGKGPYRIEIEMLPLQFCLEAGAAGLAACKRNPPLDAAAVDLRLHGLDG